MAQTYLLTTPDGEEIHVETAQAGETIITPAGKSIVVPTLRELKKLPLVEPEGGTQARAERTWSATQSIFFVSGLLFLIGFSISSVFLYRMTPLVSIDNAVKVPQEVIETDVDRWTMQNRLDFWKFATSPDALNQMRGNAEGDRNVMDLYKWRQTFLAFSLCGVTLGLILMGAAFALPGSRID
ncbi:hypothetical protein GC197_13525 [bacterium]|nr:hypothetical protein [bacterium]